MSELCSSLPICICIPFVRCQLPINCHLTTESANNLIGLIAEHSAAAATTHAVNLGNSSLSNRRLPSLEHQQQQQQQKRAPACFHVLYLSVSVCPFACVCVCRHATCHLETAAAASPSSPAISIGNLQMQATSSSFPFSN